MALNSLEKGAIILSASGMATGGRILHHLYNRLPNLQDTVLFVGYQPEGTRGRDLLEGKDFIKIFGSFIPVKAQIEYLAGLSAHADQNELLQWLSNFKKIPKITFIVHGEKEASHMLASLIKEKLQWKNVIIPNYLEGFVLFREI